MLTDIVNKINQSNFHWTDIAIQIGIDKNDIFKIKRKNNSTFEFVSSVTQKIWDEIFNVVGLNLTDNDFTEISSIAILAAILSGNIKKEIHQEKYVKAKDKNSIENIQTTNIENETPENPTKATNSIIDNIQANKIGSKTTESEVASNNYAQSPDKTTKVLVEEDNQNVPVIHEIVKRISEWKVFGRILNLEESFLNQLQTDCRFISERNNKIIEKFSMPSTPNQSWMFWRQYLDEFDDGKLVIEEMEGAFLDLLTQIPNTVDHIVTSDLLTYIGHPFQYRGNTDDLTLDKENKLMCVRVGSKEYPLADYQNISEWIKTQKHYYDTYNMLKDLKAINFVDDKDCPILKIIENHLDATNDSGFALKGYNFVNHFCLFKQGIFAKDVFIDSYFCFLANDNVVLYLTKCSRGACHALHHSLRNVQIANILHSELQSNNITQINIIIHDETNDSTIFCKQCIDNDLFVNEETFTDVETFTLWYNKLIANNNIRKKINEPKDLQKAGNEICNIIKKDMITYEALETSNLPSFSNYHEDQMDELKKLIVLSPNQFKALHSNKKHILLRGSYGSGKSVVLFKKFEQIVNSMTDSEIVYFICNDQQSEFIEYMKIMQSKHPMKNIIICRSDELTRKTEIIPRLSFLLDHIKHVWEDKTVHILIDEFSGSYFTNSDIVKLRDSLRNFQSSFIIISLQSMEQNIVEVENKKLFSDFGYQFSKLTKKTSFTCFNLDYSLRNSSEINQFVKATVEILESSRVSVAEEHIFSDHRIIIVDREHGMECSNKDLDKEVAILKAEYKYNQNEMIGHAVTSGLVNVYHCGIKDVDERRERYIVYLSTLEYILKDLSEVNKYVICTYESNVYGPIRSFLKASLLDWTISVKEFMKTNSKFTILLTDYAGVRGYEFSNFIFLSPLGKRFLKYRMVECFTRCTTRLHIISDEINVTSDSIDHQLIMKWKELNCVYFLECKYDKSTDKYFLFYGDSEIHCKENPTKLDGEPLILMESSGYPWNETSKVEDVDVSNVQDDIWIGLRCIVGMDNIRLFNDFIKLHNLDVYTYRGINDMNLLHIASEYDAVAISQILINDYKIDVNSEDKYKNTPLFISAFTGSFNVVDILIKNGADVNVKNKDGDTSLHNSSLTGYVNIVQLLLNNGADVNVKNEDGNTSLLYSSFKGNINIVQLLMDYGADVNVKNKIGNTSLHKSSLTGNINIIQLLLNNGADVNAKNENGNTSLHRSSFKGYINIVQLLLNNGADVNVKNKNYETAIDFAEQHNHPDIVELLKRYK